MVLVEMHLRIYTASQIFENSLKTAMFLDEKTWLNHTFLKWFTSHF